MRCPHCKLDLSPNLFFANSARKTGASTLCKACFRVYESSPERRAKRTWNVLHCRVRLQPSYAHVKVAMSRHEFLAWAVPAYREWTSANPGLTPSLDRIESSGDYAIGNLRVLERGHNARLAKNHPNVYAPEGTAWCGVHKSYLPTSDFQRSAGNYNGLQQRCRECQNALTSQRTPPIVSRGGRPASSC